MMSYPNGGSRSSLPRAEWLARAAHAARVDFRLLVIMRDASNLTRSVDRRFRDHFAAEWSDVDGADPVGAAMTRMADALSAQLRAMPRGVRMACAHYEGDSTDAPSASRTFATWAVHAVVRVRVTHVVT